MANVLSGSHLVKYDFKLPPGWAWRRRPDIDAYQFYMVDDTTVCFDVSTTMLAQLETNPGMVIGSIRGQMDNAKLAAMARAMAPSNTERKPVGYTMPRQYSIGSPGPRSAGAGLTPTFVEELPPIVDSAQVKRIKRLQEIHRARQRENCAWRTQDKAQFRGLGGLMPCKTCGTPIAENFNPDNCVGQEPVS